MTDLWDRLSSLSFRPAGKPVPQRDFKRILLVKPSSLGDVIHALPVLHGLRARYPRAIISWLVATPYAPLIEHHPDLNHTIRFDRKRYGRMARGIKPAGEFIKFLRSLRQQRFDLVVDLQGLFRSGFLAWATGAGTRMGFSAAREMAWMFYTHRVPVEDRDMHAVDRNYRIGALLGFDDVPMQFNLGITDDDRTAASGLLRAAGVAWEMPFWTVWPGARWETKRWPPDRFAAAIDMVQDRYGLPAVLMGDPGERSLCRQLASATRSKPAVLAGRTGIREAAAVLERAAVVLTHDSAPMHMAAALGRPLVAILGPTNRNRTGPYGNASAVLQASLSCVPCYLKRLAQCPYDHRCMNDVEVGDVVARVGAARAQVGTNRGNSLQNGVSSPINARSGADTASSRR
ncbi:MAG: lipopolysaccharide heptosyltransferase II [Phycisphaerae bacterium]